MTTCPTCLALAPFTCLAHKTLRLPSLADALFKALEEQCALRSVRNTIGRDENGKSELEWITKEREFMFTQVNQRRAELSKPPVSMKDIRRVEDMASGHSDYTRKFAIYCAELVLFADSAAQISP